MYSEAAPCNYVRERKAYVRERKVFALVTVEREMVLRRLLLIEKRALYVYTYR